MGKGQGITVTLRKVSTGYRVCAFQLEDLDHAYSLTKVIIRSPEYSRCFAVANDWQGDQLFTVYPEQVQQGGAPYQAPAPPQPHYAPQLGAYVPQQGYPQPGYASPPPPPPQYQGQVIDAQFEPSGSDFGPPPGYPALPMRRR